MIAIYLAGKHIAYLNLDLTTVEQIAYLLRTGYRLVYIDRDDRRKVITSADQLTNR